jgi:tetratricopeptide (TPR) repeat protein
MLNINELESRWKRYKIKSYIPHFVILISSLIILTISLIFLTPKEKQLEQESLVQEIQIPKVIATKPQEKNSTEQVIQKQEVKEAYVEAVQPTTPKNIQTPSSNKKITLTPSLDFMKSINRDSLPYYTQVEDDATSQAQDEKLREDQEESQSDETKESKVQIQNKEPETINIKKGTTQDDIQHVLKRFQKNNNPALSLFIAQKYYDLGDYHNSYNYALITNEINNNIEESWIIFTKSLIKLGQKEMAVKTLKQYLEYSNSSKAGRLLEEILSGKFQ